MKMIKYKLLPAILTLLLILPAGFAGTTVFAAEGIAISTAEDLKAMEENPSGSYYLTKDIEVPENMSLFVSSANPFTGTLDGKGHALKNHNITKSIPMALILEAKNATFKNIKVTGFKANVTDKFKPTFSVSGLVRNAANCTFSSITTSGSIGIDTNKFIQYVGGIVGNATNCTFSKCTNGISISVAGTDEYGCAGGIAGKGYGNKFTSCSNTGSINVNAGGIEDNWQLAGISPSFGSTFNSCKNSGNITYKIKSIKHFFFALYVGGIATDADSVTGCSNKGKVSVDTTAASSTTGIDNILVAGVVGSSPVIKRCSNQGAVSYTGAGEGKNSASFWGVGGVAAHKIDANTSTISESYNKGNVTVKISSGRMNAGGVAADVGGGASNCYNKGTISMNTGYACGGVFGYIYPGSKSVSGLYNVGKVSGGAKFKGGVLGCHDQNRKCTVKNTYYTSSGKGAMNTSRVKSCQSSPKKVSSITASKCKGLSSKYWVYSKKYKRMILKNNKEA